MAKKSTYLFALLFVTACFLLVLFVQPPVAFLFGNAQGDCNGRSIFMHSALYKNSNNPQVVFFGSSKTMNGINDSLMNRLGGETFLNMGYCRFGRNLDYFFIEEYCKTHRPQKIVLEVRGEESMNSHPVAPFLMPVDKIALGVFSLNGDLFADLYNKWLCNLKFIRKTLFRPNVPDIPLVSPDAGFWYGYKEPIPNQLKAERHSDSLKLAANPGRHDEPLNPDSRLYFKKLAALCKAKHIQLYVLYLSSYGNVLKQPACYASYRQYSTYLSIPDSILRDVDNFADFGHFNLQGADKASAWLYRQLKND